MWGEREALKGGRGREGRDPRTPGRGTLEGQKGHRTSLQTVNGKKVKAACKRSNTEVMQLYLGHMAILQCTILNPTVVQDARLISQSPSWYSHIKGLPCRCLGTGCLNADGNYSPWKELGKAPPLIPITPHCSLILPLLPSPRWAHRVQEPRQETWLIGLC